MDLTTRYLGLTLAHPLVVGASPLTEDLGIVSRLEDAGAAAIVTHSLFEEDIIGRGIEADEYLEQLLRIKRRVSVPVIASLNGTNAEGWLHYARLIQQAGADALELNFYHVATDPTEDAGAVERRLVDIVAVLKESIPIPLAVKLSPFYSSIANFAKRLDDLGFEGLVLFNRFYQPDIDPEQMEVLSVNLSNPSELTLRLRWIGVLSGRVRASLAATGGVHTVLDAVKAVMAGAHAVQMVSALLALGPKHLRYVRDELARWLEEHEYESLAQMQGSMSLLRCADPRAYERANYVKILQSWILP